MIEWIQSHADDLVQLALAAIGLASIIAKLTPTPKDDNLVKKLVDLVNAIALNPKK